LFVLIAPPSIRGGPAILPDAGATRSLSGEFIIHDHRPHGPSELSSLLTTNAQFTSFDPTVLAVSCERLKTDLFHELRITVPAGDRVHLVLHPAQSGDDQIAITSEHFRDSWQYRVDLPDAADRTRYVRAMVQVILLEFANRGAEERPAEIPLWLVEGLTRQMLASDGAEIIVPPPRRNVNGIILTSLSINARKERPLDAARIQLRGHEQMTFQDLSWPRDDALTGESGQIYQLTAQVLVSELLNLNAGRDRMREFLSLLPKYLNWQIAFLRAFHSDFGRIMDVEKWWTLRLLRFTAREPAQTWPLDESWRKLEQALHPSVEVRDRTNALPVRSETTLQTVVKAWDRKPQEKTIQAKLFELELMRPRLAPALAPLAAEYEHTLKTYLTKTDKSHSVFTIRKKSALRAAQTNAVEHLDQLDLRRSALQPRDEPVVSARQKPLEPLP
jgi:hypothetical protein